MVKELNPGWWSVLSGIPQLAVLEWIAFNTLTSAPDDGMAGTSVDDAKLRGALSALEI